MRLALGVALGVATLATITVVRLGRTTVISSHQTHLVVMEGMKFSPTALRIRAGDQVVFKNNDLVPHTATSKEKGRFDSGSLNAGESWPLTFRNQGSFPFVCSFHPMMEGMIVVAAPE